LSSEGKDLEGAPEVPESVPVGTVVYVFCVELKVISRESIERGIASFVEKGVGKSGSESRAGILLV
jgi:hypothetical protein